MSESHKHNLPIIKKIMLAWGIEHAWPEVKARHGERADVFGFFGLDVEGLWLDELGREIKLHAGQTVVSEFKETRADLRADEDKRCRQGNSLSLGDWRFKWIRRHGEIRPEMIPEGDGWGVVTFDTGSYQIVRPPARNPQVARWETVRIVAEQLKREQYRDRNPLVETASAPITPATLVGGKPLPKTVAERYPDKTARMAEAYIEEGPAPTHLLKRYLEAEANWSGSPDKLTKHLKQRSNRLIPPKTAGGDWTIKESS